MKLSHPIQPCLWFDKNGEDAAKFYCSIFPNSKITQITHYPPVNQEIHGQKPGSVLTVSFELNGQTFTALNGGPQFKFNEAVSLMIICDTQDEIDYYWTKLGEGGDPKAQICGWLKDKFGLSWQVAPQKALDMWKDTSTAASQRAFAAMMKMKKLDLAALEKAYNG
jgi:predicted 3-demethylubiquinone-9 3-methyltransferase (glyoxalase superfamily)